MDSNKLKEEVLSLKDRLESVETGLTSQMHELASLEEKWKKMDEEAVILSKDNNAIVNLNISGKKFSTRLETLVSIKDTLFYKLILSQKFDLSQEIFFDRSPKFFPIIIDYLRYKKINYKRFNNDELNEFYNEAVYFELTDIIETIGDRTKDIEFIKLEVNGFYMYNSNMVGTGKLEDLNDKTLSKGICATSPGWILIELNNEWEIDEIEIGGYNGNKNSWACENGANAEIMTSVNKINWTTVGNIPNGYGSSVKNVRLTRSAARFIKFVATGYLGIGYLEIKRNKS
jgi:hypothetical protein